MKLRQAKKMARPDRRHRYGRGQLWRALRRLGWVVVTWRGRVIA